MKLGLGLHIQTKFGGLHADTKDWVARVIAAGSTVDSVSAKNVDKFVRAIYSAGIRGKIGRLNLFAGADLTAAMVPLFNTTSLGGSVMGAALDTNNNFLSANYSVAGGLGDTSNTTKWVDTGLNLNTYAHFGITDFMQGFYKLNEAQDSGILMGNYNGASARNYLWGNYTSNLTYFDTMSAGETNKSYTNGRGLWLAGKNGSSTGKLWHKGVDLAISIPSAIAGKINKNVPVMSWKNADTPGLFSISKSSGYIMSQYLVDAEVGALNTAWDTFVTGMGR